MRNAFKELFTANHPRHFRNHVPLTRDLRNAYFSQLSDEELTALHQIYRPDFELFEYEFNLSQFRG